MENSEKNLTGRKLKKRLEELFVSENWQSHFSGLGQDYQSKLIGPLFHHLYNANSLIKWRSVDAFGILAEIMLEKDRNQVRNIIRRIIWMLTEESGGVPWGAPEVMAEILTKDRLFAEEYSTMLVSYVYDNEGGPEIYLDNDILRRGAYWGISRVAQVFPDLIEKEIGIVKERVNVEEDPVIIANMIRIFKILSVNETEDFFQKHKNDEREVEIYDKSELNMKKIMELV